MPIEVMGIKFSKDLHYIDNPDGSSSMNARDKGSAYSTIVGQIECESEPLSNADPTKTEWKYTVHVSFKALNSEWTLNQILSTPEMTRADTNELMKFVKRLYNKAMRRELKASK